MPHLSATLKGDLIYCNGSLQAIKNSFTSLLEGESFFLDFYCSQHLLLLLLFKESRPENMIFLIERKKKMPKKVLALLKDEATKNWQSYWKSLKPFFLHCALINFVKCFAILLQPQQPLFKRPSKKSIFQLCVKTKAEFGKMHLSAILEVSNAFFRQKAWRWWRRKKLFLPLL